MPNGVFLHDQFYNGRKWTRVSLGMTFAAFGPTLLGWIFYGIVGLAWAFLFQGVTLLVAVVSTHSISWAIYMALRGTKDETDFMERTRQGDVTYRALRDLWPQILSTERELRRLKASRQGQTGSV